MFMGEENSKRVPFHYSIDHGDETLIEACRKGRVAEFVSFGWTNKWAPFAMNTVKSSRLPLADKRNEGQQHLEN